MNKSFESSSGDFNGNSKDEYLRHLNKISHKISKQPIVKKSHSDSVNPNPNHSLQQFHLRQPPPPSLPPSEAPNLPPVYNISKSDFREVVQKLTGSPVHERLNKPPPIQQPKASSSRLHRIRPPPLAHVSNRPPSLLNSAAPPPSNAAASIQRQVTPLSPLPPLPSVHAAAESPISAYMRYLHGTISAVDSEQKPFSGFSPAPSSERPPTGIFSTGQQQFPLPFSPLPFGCFSSPKSSHALLSPNLLFSPTSGQLGFPQFPSVSGEP